MAAELSAVIRHIRQVAAVKDGDRLSDGQLLEEFARHHDETAFAVLMKRHGAMVLRVCLRVLQHQQDAEDALQATFLVLARNAAAIRKREALASWLHGVAYRVASNAKRAAARRRAHEKRTEAKEFASPTPDLAWREVQAVLDDEIRRLPDKYRSLFVLCCLEGQSRVDVARALCLKEGTVSGRLAEARKLLQRRLARRGITLSALLGAVALTEEARATAPPALLLQNTAKAAVVYACGTAETAGLVSSRVAALIDGTTGAVLATKIKIAASMLLLVGALAIGSSVLPRFLPAWEKSNATEFKELMQAESPPPQSKLAAKTEPDSQSPQASEVVVKGRVLDPSGQPISGAKIYFDSTTSGSSSGGVRATSKPDGQFQFTLLKSEAAGVHTDDLPGQVIGVADGYGPDWNSFSKDAITLRLVSEAALNGKFLDSDGKPVAGARVRVRRIERFPAMDLTTHLEGIRKGTFRDQFVSSIDYAHVKAWNGPFPNQLASIRTGPDGRFRMAGFGPDEIVSLGLEGSGIHYVEKIDATTRPGAPAVWPKKDRDLKVYGASFDYVVAVSRPIRGTVRDKGTGRAIAGARVSGYSTTHRPVTDKDGRYELLGYPKSEQYRIVVQPPEGLPYFAKETYFKEMAGFAPLTCDIDLVRGISCRGRLMDKDTGRPVQGGAVSYYVLYPNPFEVRLGPDLARPPSSAVTAADGSYSLVVLPGPGVLGFTGSLHGASHAQMLASFTRADLVAVFGDKYKQMYTDALPIAAGSNSFSVINAEEYNALILLHPAQDADSLTCDADLHKGGTVTGRVLGPDGKPLIGIAAWGLDSRFGNRILATDSFTIQRLNPMETRTLIFYHEEKALGAVHKVRGSETAPQIVRLQPCGTAQGRIVDGDGQPLAGLAFECNNYRRSATAVTTDQDGRFRVEGLIPGHRYTVHIRDRSPVLSYRTLFGPFTIKSGEIKDLGQAKVVRKP